MLENITMGYKRGKNGSTHGRDVRLFFGAFVYNFDRCQLIYWVLRMSVYKNFL
jgi:hypothetical protein